MKKLILALVIMTNLSFTTINCKVIDGSIVIIDTDCIVSLEESQNSISKLIIYNTEGIQINEIPGCMESKCIISLAHLPSGEYTAEVLTTSGDSFRSLIALN